MAQITSITLSFIVRKVFFVAPVIALCLAAQPEALAQSDAIYLCTDKQGNKYFANEDAGSGCKRLDVGPVLSHPPAQAPPAPKRARSVVPKPVAPDPSPPAAEPRHTTGTAFLVNAQGYAITNYHVVAGCSSLSSSRGEKADVVAIDKASDLAVIKLPGLGIRPSARLAAVAMALRQGEEIAVFGYPLASVLDDSGNFTPGVVSALSGLQGDPTRIQITAPIQPGSSGSPVLNKAGAVVAVVDSRLSDSAAFRATGSVPQTVNFAVTIQRVRQLLDANGIRFNIHGGERPQALADLADLARRWTFRVDCRRD